MSNIYDIDISLAYVNDIKSYQSQNNKNKDVGLISPVNSSNETYKNVIDKIDKTNLKVLSEDHEHSTTETQEECEHSTADHEQSTEQSTKETQEECEHSTADHEPTTEQSTTETQEECEQSTTVHEHSTTETQEDHKHSTTETQEECEHSTTDHKHSTRETQEECEHSTADHEPTTEQSTRETQEDQEQSTTNHEPSTEQTTRETQEECEHSTAETQEQTTTISQQKHKSIYNLFNYDIEQILKNNIDNTKELKIPLLNDEISTLQVLDKITPIFYFHSKETYFSIDVNEYIKYTQLRHKRQNKKVPLKRPPLKYTDFIEPIEYDFTKTSSPLEDTEFYISPIKRYKQQIYKGAPPNKLNDVPIYARLTQTDKYYRVLYTFFCPYNEGYKVPSLNTINEGKFTKQTGHHEADWEHVIFYYDKNTFELSKARYSAHGKYEGNWLTPEELEFDKQTNKPIVYISHKSHACYPTAGNWARVYGFANDYCDRGYRWEPRVLILPETYKESLQWSKGENIIQKNTPSRTNNKLIWTWTFYRGQFGNDGVTSPCTRDWWNKDVDEDIDTNVSIRFFRILELRDKFNSYMDTFKQTELYKNTFNKLKTYFKTITIHSTQQQHKSFIDNSVQDKEINKVEKTISSQPKKSIPKPKVKSTTTLIDIIRNKKKNKKQTEPSQTKEKKDVKPVITPLTKNIQQPMIKPNVIKKTNNVKPNRIFNPMMSSMLMNHKRIQRQNTQQQLHKRKNKPKFNMSNQTIQSNQKLSYRSMFYYQLNKG